MTEAKNQRRKTNWGCLLLLIIPTAIFAGARARDIWVEKQPLHYHLRNTFKESGFTVPDYVTEIDGWKGFVDFQGNYAALISFTVRDRDINHFMKLSPKIWKRPEEFKPIPTKGNFWKGFELPAGTFVIQESTSSEYNCKYAVDKTSNRVYFYRSST